MSWGEGLCKTKNLPWGEYEYFLELHIIKLLSFKSVNEERNHLTLVLTPFLTMKNLYSIFRWNF